MKYILLFLTVFASCATPILGPRDQKVQPAYKKVRNDMNRTNPELKILADLNNQLFPNRFTGSDTVDLLVADTIAANAYMELLMQYGKALDSLGQRRPMDYDTSGWNYNYTDIGDYTFSKTTLDSLKKTWYKELTSKFAPQIKIRTITDTVIDGSLNASYKLALDSRNKQAIQFEANWQAAKQSKGTFMWCFIVSAVVNGIFIALLFKKKTSIV